LAATPRKPLASDSDKAGEAALEGERKTVTALFADIKGSTELEQDLDPEEARAIVDPALKLMIDAVRRYDGYIVQSTGDGSSRSSARRSRTRIIRSARFTPRFASTMRTGAMPTGCAPTGDRHCRSE
jgi:class 3 adenylate cyclase